MFSARDLNRTGFNRSANYDYRKNGCTYKCYMYDDLKVFYARSKNVCVILIKIPYQNYNFTYEDARNTSWFKYSEGLFEAEQLTITEVLNRVDLIKKGVIELNKNNMNTSKDASFVSSHYDEEIKAAKVAMNQFMKKFDWIHADEDIRKDSTKAYKQLEKVVNAEKPAYESMSPIVLNFMKKLIERNGYLNSVIHYSISVLQKAI